ncbi:MAG TPA: YceI family protein [Pyrinomonadaceae bacterium]|nr:YceI family protein [Pyrinomonadaceae bacterium]
MLRSRVALVAIAALLFFSACNNPASDKPKAVVGEATNASASPVAAAEKYVITPENSKIEFIGAKVTGHHNGSFQKFSGTIDYAGQIEKSRVSLTIDSSSLETDTPDLTKHLKTSDFFDVAKYPNATFESTEIKPGGDKGSHTVTGNLTMHGVKKSISFPATIGVSAGEITVESSFAINRKDFGISYAGAPDNLIRDDVALSLHVKATKQ